MSLSSRIEKTPQSQEADEIVRQLLSQPPDDPYPLLSRLREIAPVHRVPGTGVWTVAGYAELQDALRDPRFIRDFRDMTQRQHGNDVDYTRPMMDHKRREFSQLNPPEYLHKRSVLTKSVTPVAVSKIENEIAHDVNKLLDAADLKSEIDLVADFSYALTLTLVCRVLGFPSPEGGTAGWLDWFRAFGDTFQPSVTEEALDAGDAAILNLNALIARRIEEMRQSPSDNMITQLMQEQYNGAPLSDEDIIANAVFMLGGAVGATSDSISNAVICLMQNRDQWELLTRDPEGLAKNAVEEALRYDNAVLANPPNRLAVEDVEIGGITIPAGDAMIPLYGAANRDPKRFKDPDTFDILRKDIRPLGFGGGQHVCPGMHLARAEVRIALETLAARFPGMHMIETDPPRRTTPVVRGVSELRVRLA